MLSTNMMWHSDLDSSDVVSWKLLMKDSIFTTQTRITTSPGPSFLIFLVFSVLLHLHHHHLLIHEYNNHKQEPTNNNQEYQDILYQDFFIYIHIYIWMIKEIKINGWNNKILDHGNVKYPQSNDPKCTKKYFLYFIVGASGSGKTYLLSKPLKT